MIQNKADSARAKLGVQGRVDEDVATDLYDGLLRKRRSLGPTDALRGAQLEMIRRNREEYGEARPADWAAFIAAGDWR